MIAINFPDKIITFHSGMTDIEKYKAVKHMRWTNPLFICYYPPKFLKDYEGNLLPIPDRISFAQDPNL